MSFLNESGSLHPFTEVVPDSAQFGPPEKSSILTARRRARIIPQTGTSYGQATAGTGAGGSQIQFLLADQGGLVDPASIVVNYTIFTSGTGNPCPDDGHPFLTVQALVNGQLVEQITNAPKLTNVEMTMGGSFSYYKSAGSFQGFQLLNNDLVTNVPSSSTTASITAWGYVIGNQPSIAVRSSRAAATVFNNIPGMQVSVPLGLIMGLGRCKSYLPIALLGELSFIFITGQPNDVLFSTGSATGTAAGDYSLSQVSMEYDIVVPDTRYMQVLQKVAMEDGQGLVIPYESSIVTTGANISASASALTETSLIASRATNHLLRSSVVQVPTNCVSLLGFPGQCTFSHAGVYSIQWRVGSIVYPQIAAQGDASIFNMSLLAYGSADNENGSTTNRVLWGQSTSGATAGTPAVLETADAASGGTTKFCYADRFVPTYGFQTVKGPSQPLAVDGISLAGSSGSQIIVSIISAPGVAYTPFVILTALRFLKAQGGAVSVVGA
jgi:hypothetical protein